MLKKHMAISLAAVSVSCLLLSACTTGAATTGNYVKNSGSGSADAKGYVTSIGGSCTDKFLSVCKASDGGVAAAGYSNSSNGSFTENNGGSDAVLALFDSSGSTKWIKNIGGSKSDKFESSEQTSDGGFIALGSSNSNDGDISGNKGDYDAILARFDSSGNLLWVKDFGGSKFDDMECVQQTTDGGFIAVGYSNSTDGDFSGLSGYDAVLVRLDSSGNIQWVKSFGGSKADEFKSVVQTSDGGFIAAGESESSDGSLSENKGESDAILAKFDENGNIQWVKDFGGSKSESFNSVQQTSDGGFAAAGYSESSDGDFAGLSNKGAGDAILARFDESGNVKWVKDFGGSKSDIFNSIQQTADGGFIAVGASLSSDGDMSENDGSYDAVFAMFDSSGNVKWVKDIGGSGSDMFESVQQTSDGGFAAAGFSDSIDGDICIKMGLSDAIVVKYIAGSPLPAQTQVVDTQPPVITVTNAKSGASVENGGYTSGNVNVTVSDDRLKTKTVSRNGIQESWGSDYLFTSSGYYVIEAADMLGNTTKFTFSIDNNPPVIKAIAEGKTLETGATVSTNVALTVLNAAGKSVTMDGTACDWPAGGIFKEAGKYVVTVKDKNGCTGSFTFTIES